MGSRFHLPPMSRHNDKHLHVSVTVSCLPFVFIGPPKAYSHFWPTSIHQVPCSTSGWCLDALAVQSVTMTASMSSHHQVTSFLRTVPLLKSLSEDQLGRVARAMDLKTYQNGELIIREDEEGDAFYIVVQVSTGTDSSSSSNRPRPWFALLTFFLLSFPGTSQVYQDTKQGNYR